MKPGLTGHDVPETGLMTTALEVRPPIAPEARWTLPTDIGSPSGAAFADALIAVASGNEQALQEHREAAIERSRLALPEMLLAGARQALSEAQLGVRDALMDPGATITSVEAALQARHAAAERVAVMSWRTPSGWVKTPAADRLRDGISDRVRMTGWACMVGIEHRLFSNEQIARGVARAAAGVRHPFERAQEAAALLDRTDGIQDPARRKNASEFVAETEGAIQQARMLLGLIDYEGVVV